MTRFRKPQHGEVVRKENYVIGHIDNRTIVKNEKSVLYFVDCDENQAPVGTIFENQALTPISKLPEEEQKKIRAFAASLGV